MMFVRIAVLLLALAVAIAAAAGAAKLVDINRATSSELKTLPGIADAWAAAIAKNRPYKNKRQLLTRKVISEAAYNRIKGKIVARQ
jgi:DNA uptake protein ComE-like DNA-binding protein